VWVDLDPIKGQGHGAFEVAKIALFYVYLLRRFAVELNTDGWFDSMGKLS